MKHVVIVGAGVIGLSTAWYCRKRGWDVTVIDRKPAHRDGCSYGNAGMIVPSHFVPLAAPGMIKLGLKWMWNPESPFYIKPRFSWDLLAWLWQFRGFCNAQHVQRVAPALRDLHLASRSLYEQMDVELPGGVGLSQRGLIMICRTRHGLQEEATGAKLAERMNVAAQVLNCDELSQLEPNLTMTVAGGVYYPLDCHLSPAALMANLQSDLERQGVAFRWSTDVTGFDHSDGTIHAVQTTQGDVTADQYTLCAGAWSPTVGQALGLRLPMQAGKGYSLTLENPCELPKLCAILTEARVAVTPIGNSLRFGGTMEIAGLNETIGPRRIRGIVRSVSEYFPKFGPEDFSQVHPWVGLRPCAPDGLPYLGRPMGWKNLVINSGHAMMGISLAPISAKITAETLDGTADALTQATSNPIPLAIFSPNRFA